MPPETKRSNRWWRIAALLALIAAGGAFYLSGLYDLLRWDYVRSHLTALREATDANRPLAFALFFLVYVACTSLPFPSALVLSLLAGALFRFVGGLVLVSIASTVGACAAFLISRHLLRESVQRRFGTHLRTINRGMERDGAWYLLALRLTPAVPYFLINFSMGLTPISLSTYAVVSWLGMLPVTMVLIYAGQTLESLRQPSDVFSPRLVVALALMALVPLVLRWLMRRMMSEPVPEEASP